MERDIGGCYVLLTLMELTSQTKWFWPEENKTVGRRWVCPMQASQGSQDTRGLDGSYTKQALRPSLCYKFLVRIAVAS